MAEMVNRDVGEDSDGVDRGETSHTAELENEDELDEDEDAWALQESSSGPLGDVAVGAMSDDGAGDTDATTAQGYDSYDFLPPLQRLEKYALTLLYKRDRNMVGRLFLETLKSVADNPHDVATVMWILYNMSENEDPSIRTELMDHIPHIAMLCHSEKEKLLYVVDHLLPFVAKQLTDNDAQVRKAAQVTLLVLMDQSLVGQSAVEEIVCPVVNVLSETDQYPVNAVQLMSKMAPFLGRVATEQLFLARFCDLCRNSDMQVRKMCAAYFGEFCAVVGQPTTEENLLCRFVDLCQDDVPGVRKACAEVIMSVSCACTLQRRKTVLAPMFVSLLWDPVRWVRSSAFKTLGPFISTFAVPSVADLVYNENGELVLVNREGCEFRLNPNIDRGDTDMEDDLGCDTRKDKTLPRAHKSRPPTRIEDIKNFDRKGEQNLLQRDNTIENSLDQDMSSTSSTPVTTPEENDFNSFYFWRVPIPDISDQDEAVEDGVLDYLTGLVNASNATVAYREDDNSDLFSSKTSEAGHRQDIVPQELVELFVSMTNPPHAHMTDIEIALHCAFSLPAVALTLGRENWGFLRGTYERLAADMQWKVRKTVACSVHELAEILGEELTAKDLVPIYTGFIKDLDEVRIGALKHLADFVKLLPSCKRKSFLSQFEMFLVTDNEWNWRFREELAQQLLRIIPLYTPEETCVHLVPVAIALLRDKVAAVRTTALLLVTCLINHVTSEGPLLRKLLPLLAQEFANSTRWERRQAFALLCSHLVAGRVLGGDQFAREVLPYLLDLSYDKVPNVRLAVARTLASDIMAHQFFSSDQSPHQEVLMQVLKRLINDKDRDVRFFADPRRGAPSQIQQQLSSGASHVQLPTC
ncbi:serine/threonine-protein phosphatase 4 regulatory subunit 1-like isoform X4 [Thrips palmi]|uniref:Serine/threonine-protein phosphatase 4 regulatory subunit 1-like isoform X4 n=1 Tax=Thrips palmi TaxID=161013 RepID=A0A6P8XZQ4_THRPL|nr:serine/threonine-protein phosphatase 4 regulatory subunit 1-like isoform X4 [Thrips palmi]